MLIRSFFRKKTTKIYIIILSILLFFYWKKQNIYPGKSYREVHYNIMNECCE